LGPVGRIASRASGSSSYFGDVHAASAAILEGWRRVVNARPGGLTQRMVVGFEERGGKRRKKMTICLRPLARAELRLLDARSSEEMGIPGLALMENAGRGSASLLAELAGVTGGGAGVRFFTSGDLRKASDLSNEVAMPKVMVLCGAGNNGGDGGVAARHLDAWGFDVRVLWLAHCAEIREEAAVQWHILRKSGVDQIAWYDVFGTENGADLAHLEAMLKAADWIVDGLLGTGLSRVVEGHLRRVIETMNHTGKPILSLDLPSGLDADTGRALGVAVRACATATFVAPKLGFGAPGAVVHTGEVAVIDIGLPRCLLEPYVCGG
jgi:NAD(P)H-hydrate epimerase